jgi:excisionase family DNA binding protein
MSEKLLTPAEVASLYDVSSKTVLRWLADGRIPAEINEGQIVRFDAGEVSAALKRNANKKAKQRKSIV